MKFPTLYKKTSTGAIQMWQIEVDGSTIITTYGQLHGKQQIAKDTITSGKNIGRSNETTPEQQAELEAKSQWEKKCKKHYVTDPGDAQADVVDMEYVTGGVLPMLAHSYAKQGHKIEWPAYGQPKLDGHRCIAIISNGKCTLWSRTQKPITGVPHIIKALEAVGLDDVILDGELYNHDYRNKFEELTSFIRQETPKAGHEVVQYHIYDIVDTHMRFAARTLYLNVVPNQHPLVLVKTARLDSAEELSAFFANCLKAGYEGAMVRNALSKYENKRSYGLQKVKSFDDDEFEVVNVEEGRGKMKGKGIFVCKTPGNKEFHVKMIGNIEALSVFLLEPADWIGKMLTVQYQGLTSSGIPRFPIGLRFREDI